jgi:excisionase family DNA binding protein
MTKSKRRASAEPKRPFAERGGALMTPAEAGDYLGVGERMARRLLAEGAIPKVKVGKLVRVSVADLDAYVEQQRVPGAAS